VRPPRLSGSVGRTSFIKDDDALSARKTISTSLQRSVLTRSGRRCALCFGLHEDLAVKRGQLAHLDGDAANAREPNLVFLCLPHHDEYDSVTSQSKGLTPPELTAYRDRLYAVIEADRRRARRRRTGVGGRLPNPTEQSRGRPDKSEEQEKPTPGGSTESNRRRPCTCFMRDLGKFATIDAFPPQVDLPFESYCTRCGESLKTVCWRCNGTGKSEAGHCSNCGGTVSKKCVMCRGTGTAKQEHSCRMT